MNDLQLLSQIEVARVLQKVNQLAQIGALETGGVARLAFSREDYHARQLLEQWIRDAGMQVERDSVGNIIGTLASAEPNAPIVATGSHIDTVPNAGKLDGVLGVLAAIECARVLSENSRMRASLQVICFVMEESARFGRGYGFGSRVMTGRAIDDSELLARDASGKTLAQAIAELSAWETGTPIPSSEVDVRQSAQKAIRESRRDFSRHRAFVELHIEQGPVLEKTRTRIGLVTAIAAPTRLMLTFIGEQNHSGTTPMNMRRDALVAAAEVIVAVEKIAKKRAECSIVATVGVVKVEPGSVNVIPGRVEMAVDIRGIDAQAKDEAMRAILDTAREIAEARGITFNADVLADEQPIHLSKKILEASASVCEELKIDARQMPSGAGHDAAHFATVASTGMIFVLSIGGISHDPREATSDADIELGARVLLGTLIKLMSDK